MLARPAGPGDPAAVVALIAAHQVRPDRSIVYLGTTEAGIVQELDALEPPWRDTLRVVRSGATVVGACIAEWDHEVKRAWVLGPWVDVDESAWTDVAEVLFDAAVEQLPAGIRDVEIAGTVEHTGLAALASARGMEAGPVNHVMTIRTPLPVASSSRRAAVVRPAGARDEPAIELLHDAEFPATHSSTAQLLARASRDEALILVATSVDEVVGYAAGQVQPDGEGVVDFVAVATAHRGLGIGRDLVTTLGNRLLKDSPIGQVGLTVEARRRTATALYLSLGFQRELSFRGYRTPRAHRTGG